MHARSAGLLRRIPCRSKIGAIDIIEQSRTLGSSARLVDSPGIQFFQRPRIFRRRNCRAIRRRLRPRLLHAIPKLPRLFPAPRILHLRRQPSGRLRGVVIRVYGVEDDPKASVASWSATWFGRPMIEELRSLGMDLALVWPGLAAHEWTLWNANLFPVTTVDEAWACAQWLLRLSPRLRQVHGD